MNVGKIYCKHSLSAFYRNLDELLIPTCIASIGGDYLMIVSVLMSVRSPVTTLKTSRLVDYLYWPTRPCHYFTYTVHGRPSDRKTKQCQGQGLVDHYLTFVNLSYRGKSGQFCCWILLGRAAKRTRGSSWNRTQTGGWNEREKATDWMAKEAELGEPETSATKFKFSIAVLQVRTGGQQQTTTTKYLPFIIILQWDKESRRSWPCRRHVNLLSEDLHLWILGKQQTATATNSGRLSSYNHIQELDHRPHSG